jgi:hypothetical protein
VNGKVYVLNLESIKSYYSNFCCGGIIELGMELDDCWFCCFVFTKDLDIAIVIEELLDELSG